MVGQKVIKFQMTFSSELHSNALYFLEIDKLNVILILSLHTHFKKMKCVYFPVGPGRASSWCSKLYDRICHGSISDPVLVVQWTLTVHMLLLALRNVLKDFFGDFLFCFHHRCLFNFYFLIAYSGQVIFQLSSDLQLFCYMFTLGYLHSFLSSNSYVNVFHFYVYAF